MQTYVSLNHEELNDEANRFGGSALMSIYCFLCHQSDEVRNKVSMMNLIKSLSRKASECDPNETSHYYQFRNRGGYVVPVVTLLPYIYKILQILHKHVNYYLYQSNTLVHVKTEIFHTNKTILDDLFKTGCASAFCINNDQELSSNKIVIQMCQKSIALKLIHTYCNIRLRKLIDITISRVALANANQLPNSSRREQSKHAGHGNVKGRKHNDEEADDV
jgi:hypothetical protein